MVIAFAGRRIDAPDADQPRFPLGNVSAVRHRIRDLFLAENATALFSSGACGADLLAQEEAVKLGLHTCLVLPFSPEQFRYSSVTDRPGEWGVVYDTIVQRATRAGNLIVLPDGPEGDDAYGLVNRRILDEAILAAGEPRNVLAVIAWNGQPRGAGDLTLAFREEAERRGIHVAEIQTL
jgi:hypothetical protein